MTDVIILVILAAAVGVGIYSAIRHFKGEGGCCGGGTYKVKSRKLKHVAEVKTFTVEGMSCQHCVNRVTEAVQNNPSLSAAVQLRNGTVRVSAESKLDQEAVRAAIEKAGYTVTGVR